MRIAFLHRNATPSPPQSGQEGRVRATRRAGSEEIVLVAIRTKCRQGSPSPRPSPPLKRGRGSIQVAVAMLCLTVNPAVAAPHRVVSTFLCTDEYVFRLVARDRIAALSFEAGDRKPVVSTIADRVGGIHQIRPSTESVLALKPDL